MTSENIFSNAVEPTWCPGCGNYNILTALQNALVALSLKPSQTVIAGDIGCSSKICDYVQSFSFTGLHGRVIPLASGIKAANPQLTVLAVGGDGGIYGEGGNHLLHAARRNHNITVLVHDNKVYGLTKGQTSPTSDPDFVSAVTPNGNSEATFNPLAIALLSGASFVGRGYAGDINHLASLIIEGIRHPGFTIIDILQPCVSFNAINTAVWYNKRVYKLEDQPDYTVTDFNHSIKKTLEWGDHIPIGIFYCNRRPTFEEQQSALKNKPLSAIKADTDITPLLESFR